MSGRDAHGGWVSRWFSRLAVLCAGVGLLAVSACAASGNAPPSRDAVAASNSSAVMSEGTQEAAIPRGTQTSDGTMDADPTAELQEARPLAERHMRGGLTPHGAAHSDLTVDLSGRWILATEVGSSTGRLSPADLQKLEQVIRWTTLKPAASGEGSQCGSYADGIDVSYSWSLGKLSGAVSSCNGPVDADDPLVTVLDRLATDPG